MIVENQVKHMIFKKSRKIVDLKSRFYEVDMDRLTRKSQNTGMVWFIDHDNNGLNLEPCEMSYSQNGKAIRKLAYYEEIEEQGRLVILPCKIGDTIYYIDRYTNIIEEDTVKFFTFTKDGIKPILNRHNKKFWEFYEWGKTVFLTKEEAEVVLKNI